MIGSFISVSLVEFDGSPRPAKFCARTRNSYLCPVFNERNFVVKPSIGSLGPLRKTKSSNNQTKKGQQIQSLI